MIPSEFSPSSTGVASNCQTGDQPSIERLTEMVFALTTEVRMLSEEVEQLKISGLSVTRIVPSQISDDAEAVIQAPLFRVVEVKRQKKIVELWLDLVIKLGLDAIAPHFQSFFDERIDAINTNKLSELKSVTINYLSNNNGGYAWLKIVFRRRIKNDFIEAWVYNNSADRKTRQPSTVTRNWDTLKGADIFPEIMNAIQEFTELNP